MSTIEESLCCTEIPGVQSKIAELDALSPNSLEVQCITDHPGFVSVCLDEWVLQTAYYGFRQQYGQAIYTDHSVLE